MHDLHDRSRHDRETKEAYHARKTASGRIHRDSEAVEITPQTKVTRKDDLIEDITQLHAEQAAHDAEQLRHEKEDDMGRRSSKRLRDISLTGKEMCRREHYCKWLATQNVLDSTRTGDLRETGGSHIPSREKRPAYSGYPRSNDSANHRRNATPGPSHPYNGGHEYDDHDYYHDRSNSHTDTYKPSHPSQEETSDSYPSFKTEDRDQQGC